MEARAIGVQWNWFPDVDVNSNPDNPVINTRSFGEDPTQVGQMAAAYIEGAHEFGMLTTAKHFPGHGDTDTDSHLSVPMVNGDRQRLDTVELPPFASRHQGRSRCRDGRACCWCPRSIPIAKHVASISPPIVTGLLKQKMGFDGLIVTDALQMNGLMKLFPEGGPAASARAAVEAVKAGNDVLLLPADLDAAYNGVLNAVRSGEISEVAHRSVGAQDSARQGLGRPQQGSAGRYQCRQPGRRQARKPADGAENCRQRRHSGARQQAGASSAAQLVREPTALRCVSVCRGDARARSGAYFQRRQPFRFGPRARRSRCGGGFPMPVSCTSTFGLRSA